MVPGTSPAKRTSALTTSPGAGVSGSPLPVPLLIGSLNSAETLAISPRRKRAWNAQPFVLH
jgi:hypothetical protein